MLWINADETLVSTVDDIWAIHMSLFVLELIVPNSAFSLLIPCSSARKNRNRTISIFQIKNDLHFLPDSVQ